MGRCQRPYFPYFYEDDNRTICYPLCPDKMLRRSTQLWYPSYREFSFWVNGIITLCLVIMGSMGIVLALLSIRKNRGKRRLMWHIRVLCFWDALALFSMFGLAALPSLWYKTSEIYGTSSYFIRLFLPLSNMANLASMWQIIAITAERFLAVAYPFTSHRRNNKSPYLICAVIALGALLINGPIVFESMIGYCFNYAEKRLSPLLVPREYATNNIYQWIVRRVPNFLLRSPTPFGLLVFLTAGTLQGRKSNMPLSTHSHRHSRATTSNTTITLTIINIKFIVLQSLPVAYDIMSIMNTLSLRNQFYMADINNLLVALQSATNWLVFMQWNQENSTSNQKPKSSKYLEIAFTTGEIDMLKRMYEGNAKDNMELLSADIHDAFMTRRRSSSRFDSVIDESLNNSYTETEELTPLNQESMDSIFTCLTAEPLGWLEARDQLRELGMGMCDRYFRIDAQSWVDCKKTIVDALMGEESDDQQRLLAAKFASFVIGEIKHGMLCQRAERSRSTVMVDTSVSIF